jgi:hypothetical protein
VLVDRIQLLDWCQRASVYARTLPPVRREADLREIARVRRVAVNLPPGRKIDVVIEGFGALLDLGGAG